jgi:hypothetical protein
MEKINLKEMLEEKFRTFKVLPMDSLVIRPRGTTERFILELMKEVWNLAVDKCKENAAVLNMEDEYGDYGELDENSIEQVKKLII